jgi:hypothetical protein
LNLRPPPSFMWERLIPGVPLMISAYQFGGEHLRHRFPGVISCRVPSPTDQVLQLAPLSEEPMPHDHLDLVFFISVHHFRGWPMEIGPVLTCFAIRGQQRGVEDVMDGPGQGELEAISNR